MTRFTRFTLTHSCTFGIQLKTMKSAAGKRPPDGENGPGKEAIRPRNLLLHLWNPIEKPWKALRASVLRTKKTAPEKKLADRGSDAWGSQLFHRSKIKRLKKKNKTVYGEKFNKRLQNSAKFWKFSDDRIKCLRNDVCREPYPLFTEARWIVHPRSVLQQSIMINGAGRGSVRERQRILVWCVEEEGMKRNAAWLENGE